MSTRKVQDAKDLTTDELIYFTGHAQATYMSDGTTVEDAINSIDNSIDITSYATIDYVDEQFGDVNAILNGIADGGISGGGSGGVETDPIFSASPAAGITAEKIQEWNNKMDNVTLAAVATSGSYNDLSNKPTIPSAITVDSSMSSTSTNPVQNKIIKSYIDSNCNIPTETTTSSSKSLTANKYCRWTNTPTRITITLATPSNTSILNNYMFEFTASSSGCTLSVPSSIKWVNGTTPTIEAGKTYQISIINNLATVAKFS